MSIILNLARCADLTLKSKVDGWHLDSPKNGDVCTHLVPMKISGWLLFREGDEVSVVLKYADETRLHDLTMSRPDVIRRVLKHPPEDHPRLRCGFSLAIQSWQSFDLGFSINGQIHWAYRGRVEAMPKVEVGRSGWLFLGNDTNRSVEQFTGQRLLGPTEISQWGLNFEEIRAASTALCFDWVFLLVPGKEFIYPEYYPYPKGPTTPVDQFLAAFSNEGRTLWPIDALSNEREFAYWKGDTHWSHHGARIAASEVLDKFGLTGLEAEGKMQYVLSKRVGDLGKKLNPPRAHPVLTVPHELQSRPCYDSRIHNHGRIWVFENPAAPNDSRCVLFGDSFSVALVHWLAPLFRRLVYLHTGAAMDRAVLEHERPTHVLFQSNSRFLVAPPKCNYTVGEVIAKKMAAMTDDDRRELGRHHGQSSEDRNGFYRRLMSCVGETPVSV